MNKDLKKIAALMRQGREEIPEPAPMHQYFWATDPDGQYIPTRNYPDKPESACSMGCVIWAANRYKSWCILEIDAEEILEEMGLPNYVTAEELIEAKIPHPELEQELIDDPCERKMLSFIGTTMNDIYKIPTADIADYLDRLAEVLNGSDNAS